MRKKRFLLLCLLPFMILCCKKDEPDPEENELEISALFTRTTNPVYESPLDLAADPSLVDSGDTLFMYYTAENRKIGVVLSLDEGATWASPDGNNLDDYAALTAQANGWDKTLETVDVIRVGGQYWMYYTGYTEGGADNSHVENYEIGLAISNNGIDFSRHAQSVNQPILSRDVSNGQTNDRHAMTSPGVVYEGGTFFMIYAGWNVENNWTGSNAGIRILGATSIDGIVWTKIATPIIQPTEVTYSEDINEASLLKTPNGFWYIPFSTGSAIGIARSTNFRGPYDIFPFAIVGPTFSWDGEVTAPDGLIKDGKMSLWFHGVKMPGYWPWVIGYCESSYPLAW